MTPMTKDRDPLVHELKCWPEPFAAVKSGAKTFEWRKDDRDYRVGDTLRLMEWDPERLGADDNYMGHPIGYTWEEISLTVTYIIREGFGIPKGYCIMGLSRIAELEAKISGQQEAKLLELVRQQSTLLNRWHKEGVSLGASHPHFASYSFYADDLYIKTEELLERCKEVVPDLLVDGGDIPLPPSPTEP